METPLQEVLHAEFPDFQHFLEHERIRHLTYPFEWSFSMLAEAGLRTLGLQKDLAMAGFTLKDASAYNIQFVNGQATFIDISSIETARRKDIWFALGQFQRMFLFPLLLCEHCGWDLRSYFRANLDGRDVQQVCRSLGWGRLWRPGLWLDLTVPLVLERLARNSKSSRAKVFDVSSSNPRPQLMNLQRLDSKLRKLEARHRPGGVWKDYTWTRSCDQQASSAKQQLVREFLESTRPKVVMDLGCNTGEFSFLASACGAEVIAADADADAVEMLFRRLRKDPQPITPMVLDLGNPSPGLGFRNRERASAFDRFAPDCVLALALVHHLLVSANLPLSMISELLHSLTRQHCVLEFVPRDDEMFQYLLRFRMDLFEDLSLDSFRSAFSPKFEILYERPIPSSHRTLLFLRKR
ncbi:MAG: hypothetical protein AB9869_26830 [Verrucomicrobiia bacterium]